MRHSFLEHFARLMGLPEETLCLAEAALLIACDEYPDLDIGGYLDRIEDHASAVASQAGGPPERMLEVLNRYLFEEQNFRGNRRRYEDPRNSFLNELLDRKLGLPITLSLLYIEIGRRVGLPLQGISFPGHFLVKLRVPDGEIVLDPFSRGITLMRQDLARRLEDSGHPPPSEAAWSQLLAAANKKAIIVRMLRNLKAVYLHSKEFEKALKVCDRILTILPDHPGEHRDRGAIYQRLDCYRAALEDLRTYLALQPAADDAEAVRRQVIRLQSQAARLN
jgi:regulator of sirC expression with transglutaminase-like and TPR domain